jgi:hypothetical protein
MSTLGFLFTPDHDAQSFYRPRHHFDSKPGLNITTIAPPQQPHAYHLIIYRFRPIFAAGAKKACNGR